jgi:hypothetical protein
MGTKWEVQLLLNGLLSETKEPDREADHFLHLLRNILMYNCSHRIGLHGVVLN